MNPFENVFLQLFRKHFTGNNGSDKKFDLIVFRQKGIYASGHSDLNMIGASINNV